MRYTLTILLLGFLINLANGQDKLESQISTIDELSRQEKYESERFYGFDEPCETIWYYNDLGLIKIHKGCGDVSMHMMGIDYYFIDSFVIERNIDIYYNAPPTYSEEVAKAEGITSGWFDPNKTITDTLIYYLKSGELVHSTKNDSIINFSNGETREIVDRINKDIDFLKSKQCRYVYNKETKREIYVNADNKLDLLEFHKKLLNDYSYPSSQQEIQTRFVIEFIVETDGSTSNIKINNKQNNLTPAEKGYYDLISKMTDLQIAECNGNKIPMKYVIPIMIELR